MARIALGPAELETFLAIAELGSFSRAAERLALSQPSISNRILRLEKMLGARLFERTTRAVVLTPAGMRLRARVGPVIEELRSALDEFQRDAEERRRTVKVAASPIVAAVLIPPVLRLFRQDFPDVSIVLRDDVGFECFSGLVQELKAGTIDIAVTAAAVHHSDLAFEPLMQDECVVVGLRTSPLFRGNGVTLEELAGEPFITLSAYAADLEALTTNLRERGLAFRPSFEVANVTTLLGLVESGMGVALVPRFALRSTISSGAGRLATARLIGASMVRRIGMMHLPRSMLPPAVRALSTALKAEATRDGGFSGRTCENAIRRRVLETMNG
jgi:DNA-binding transcriptional LysR family regulator